MKFFNKSIEEQITKEIKEHKKKVENRERDLFSDTVSEGKHILEMLYIEEQKIEFLTELLELYIAKTLNHESLTALEKQYPGAYYKESGIGHSKTEKLACKALGVNIKTKEDIIAQKISTKINKLYDKIYKKREYVDINKDEKGLINLEVNAVLPTEIVAVASFVGIDPVEYFQLGLDKLNVHVDKHNFLVEVLELYKSNQLNSDSLHEAKERYPKASFSQSKIILSETEKLADEAFNAKNTHLEKISLETNDYLADNQPVQYRA